MATQIRIERTSQTSKKSRELKLQTRSLDLRTPSGRNLPF